MSKGFGKPQPVAKAGQKAKFTPIESYTFTHTSSDGCFHIVEIEARSLKEAIKRFRFFVRGLELLSAEGSGDQLEEFTTKNTLP